jgi:hypothetical protein
MIHEHHNDYISLWLTDYHTDYPLPDNIPNTIVDIIFDGNALEEIFGPDAMTELWKHAPKAITDEYGEDMYYMHLWQVSGSYDAISQVLDAFTNRVFAPPKYSPTYDFFLHTPSGDDDAFDYWPTAVDLAKQIAIDLDSINPDGKQYQQLRDKYIAFIKKGGTISEFNFDESTVADEDISEEESGRRSKAWEKEIGK